MSDTQSVSADPEMIDINEDDIEPIAVIEDLTHAAGAVVDIITLHVNDPTVGYNFDDADATDELLATMPPAYAALIRAAFIIHNIDQGDQ